MISFGSLRVLIFFDEGVRYYNDYISLTKDLFFIAFAFFITLLIFAIYYRIKERSKNSEEVQRIRLNLSSIFKTKLVQKSIGVIIFVCLFSFVAIEVWGTTELGKPFNKSSYEAVYKASLSKNFNLKNIEQIEMTVKIDRKLFSKNVIQLEYMYYNNKDIEFYDDPIYLEVGKFIPVEFYLDGKDYKWYIQMSNVKVSDW